MLVPIDRGSVGAHRAKAGRDGRHPPDRRMCHGLRLLCCLGTENRRILDWSRTGLPRTPTSTTPSTPGAPVTARTNVRIVDQRTPDEQDRPFLPGMGRTWLLPLYDLFTRTAGVRALHERAV